MNKDLQYLRETIQIARESRAVGNHPFGALLTGPDGEVLIRCGNTHSDGKGIGHAELNVVLRASQDITPDYLKHCTLYTSVEPCCMCAGACYWAEIGTVVFGMTEKRLAVITGDNPENLTLDLPCKRVFSAGQRKTEVRGPFPEIEEEVAEGHHGFW